MRSSLLQDGAAALEFEARVHRDGSISLGPELVGPFLGEALGWWRARHATPDLAREEVAATAVVSDRTAPMDPRLFRQLAAAGAFPSRRVGRQIIAVWGDVMAAVRGEVAAPALPAQGTLDDLRLRLGLAPRGE